MPVPADLRFWSNLLSSVESTSKTHRSVSWSTNDQSKSNTTSCLGMAGAALMLAAGQECESSDVGYVSIAHSSQLTGRKRREVKMCDVRCDLRCMVLNGVLEKNSHRAVVSIRGTW
jgi:hypothetical protein